MKLGENGVGTLPKSKRALAHAITVSLIFGAAHSTLAFARPSGPVTLAPAKAREVHQTIRRADDASSDAPVDAQADAELKKAEDALAAKKKELADAQALIQKKNDEKAAAARKKQAAIAAEARKKSDLAKAKKAESERLVIEAELAKTQRMIAEQKELEAAQALAKLKGIVAPDATKVAPAVPAAKIATAPVARNVATPASASRASVPSASVPSAPASSASASKLMKSESKALVAANAAPAVKVAVSVAVKAVSVTAKKSAPKEVASVSRRSTFASTAASSRSKTPVTSSKSARAVKAAAAAYTPLAAQKVLTASEIEARVALAHAQLDTACSDEATATANEPALGALSAVMKRDATLVNDLRERTRIAAIDPARVMQFNAVASTVGVSEKMMNAKVAQRATLAAQLASLQLASRDARSKLAIRAAQNKTGKPNLSTSADSLAAIRDEAKLAVLNHRQAADQVARLDTEIADWSAYHANLSTMHAKAPTDAQIVAFATQKAKEAAVLDTLADQMNHAAGRAVSCHRLAMEKKLRERCLANTPAEAAGSCVGTSAERDFLKENGIGTGSSGLTTASNGSDGKSSATKSSQSSATSSLLN